MEIPVNLLALLKPYCAVGLTSPNSVREYTYFCVFFSICKKRDFLHFFALLHTFSRTMVIVIVIIYSYTIFISGKEIAVFTGVCLFSVRLLTGLLKIFRKYYGMVIHKILWQNWLDFVGNDPDPGTFLKEFYHCDIGGGKGCFLWFSNSPKYTG